MKTIRRVLQLVMMIAVAAPVYAQIKTLGDGTTAAVQAEHLTVELIPSPESFAPGKENMIGLHFKLEAGWHVYWSNAGDAGEPPSVEWTLPKGISAGPLLFPVPKRLPVGPLMDFGYENDVIFPVKLQVARDATAGVLQAKVDWLVCREVCIPGKALLGLKYGVSSLAGIVNGEQLDALNAAVKLLPQPLPKGAALGVNSAPGEFDVLMLSGARVDHAEVYSFDQNLIANAAPQEVHPTPHGVLVRVTKDSTLTQDPATIHGLIKVSDTTAYEFTVPVVKGMMQFSGTPAASAPADTSDSTSAGEVTALTAIGLAFLGGIYF